MAIQATSNSPIPTAQMVGNAFVEQYYHFLHNSPELVYRFYQDSSVISRPDANGEMTSVATMQGINEKILSLNFMDYKAEIKTADAQKSLNEGVTVLVTGCLTGKDDLRRKFAQSFFLAPQDNGYFVLNDVFRYIEANDQLENYPDNGVDNIAAIPSTTDSDPSHVSKPPAPDLITSAVEEDKFVTENAKIPLDTENQLVQENEAAVESYPGENGDDFCVVGDSTSATQEDMPKKSYASIVKVAKWGSGPTKVYVPTNTAKVAPKKPEMQTVAIAPPPEPAASVPSSTDILESSSAQEEGEGHSIYVRNLPFNMLPSQLEKEFKKFGPIKPGGIQVRYNKQQGYCFGFVEFQSLSSMNDAIQASPVNIGGCETVIEIKRTTTRVDGGRGRFYFGRGGSRSDSFRSRGNYGGGRSFGRNEYREFSGRGRNAVGRGEGHQQGRGRGSRSGGPKQDTTNSM